MLYLIVGLVLSVIAFLAFQVADDARVDVLNGRGTGIKVLLYFLLGCACTGVSGYILFSHLGVL
ncbi:hypothetical protein [Proteus phage RP7]|nr:hypothetical protein [Proteus phage RP7]